MGKKAAKEIIERKKIDGILLTSPANMKYVANFDGEGYVFLSKEKSFVVTDARYTLLAEQTCENFEVMQWDKDHPYYSFLFNEAKNGKLMLGIESAHVTVEQLEKLKKSAVTKKINLELTFLNNEITALRAIKSEAELDLIRTAEAIGDLAFSQIINDIRPGVSEKEIAAKLEYYMKCNNADGFSFDTIVASGPNSAIPHAVPTDRLFMNGDFVTMDFGCIYKGYCSDMTRTVVVGKASEKQKQIYNVVLQAQKKALYNIKPGMLGKQIDALARDYIVKEGYGDYFTHSLGHSLGLEIHESPNFSMRDENEFKPGMVVSVEPGIYIPEFGGVRIEDVVIITENGCEDITHSKKELMEI